MEKELVTEQIAIAIQALAEVEAGEFQLGYAGGVLWMCFKAGFITEIEYNSFSNLSDAVSSAQKINIKKSK